MTNVKTAGKKIIKSRSKGFTLLEIMIAIALLGVIATALIPLFSLSAKLVGGAEDKLEATHSGMDTMELLYHLSSSSNFDLLETELIERGYAKNGEGHYTYETDDQKYIDLEVQQEGSLVRVLVKVYGSIDQKELKSQYEALYRWKTEGE